ncbi:MAG: hypothetical protein M1823_006649 [Watsoniomyces obsoletus]|nr:MAG: hypothetical protein M1823_006649 [Watsoniomyces obsoletus]
MATPEVRRGNFLYRDTLFVDLGDHKRHPRASPSELKDLLLPKGVPPKDQVAHWYEAQLVHYGLPRTKDKNTAKVRLTGAIAGKMLKVPEYLVQMEGDMKKEYARGLKKMGSVTKTGAEVTPMKGKKQQSDKHDTVAVTSISIKKGDFSFEYNSTAGKSSATAQKAKPEPKRLQAAKEPKKATPKPRSAAKATAPSSASRATAPASSPTRAAPAAAPPRPKQTARRSRPFTYPSHSSRPNQSTPQRSYDHTPTLFSNYDDDNDDDD